MSGKIDKRTWKFNNGAFTLMGHSRSAESTGFYIPELNWFFDAGLITNQKPYKLFLTHSHADHSFQIPYMYDRRRLLDIYAPQGCVKYLEAYLQAAQNLNDCIPDAPQKFALHPVQHGDHFTVSNNDYTRTTTSSSSSSSNPSKSSSNNSYEVEIIPCFHPVPTCGFAFSQKRAKLRAEYRHLPGKEIAALRKDKEKAANLMEEVTVPLFIFMGDTTVQAFETNPNLLSTYPVVITECTFLDDIEEEPTNNADSGESQSNNNNNKGCCGCTTTGAAAAGDATASGAEDKGHTAWHELRPYVKAHPATTFILIHFSMKYSNREILQFFENQKQRHGITNVIAWVDDEDGEQLQPQQQQTARKDGRQQQQQQQ